MSPENVDILQQSTADVCELISEDLESKSSVHQNSGKGVTENLRLYGNDCLEARLDAVLETLAPRERNVLRMRYGLRAGGEGMSLSDIATKYGLSRERVRQIETHAIDKLRHPLRALPLAEHVEDST